jgi:predicted DNA-binding protein
MAKKENIETEQTKIELQQRLDALPATCLFDKELIEKYLRTFNQKEFDAQGMELIKDGKHKSTIKIAADQKDVWRITRNLKD